MAGYRLLPLCAVSFMCGIDTKSGPLVPADIHPQMRDSQSGIDFEFCHVLDGIHTSIQKYFSACGWNNNESLYFSFNLLLTPVPADVYSVQTKLICDGGSAKVSRDTWIRRAWGEGFQSWVTYTCRHSPSQGIWRYLLHRWGGKQRRLYHKPPPLPNANRQPEMYCDLDWNRSAKGDMAAPATFLPIHRWRRHCQTLRDRLHCWIRSSATLCNLCWLGYQCPWEWMIYIPWPIPSSTL